MAEIVLAGPDHARARLLGNWLASCPHQIVLRSFRELAEHLATAEPDVVILDLLDGMSEGATLCDAIREHSHAALLALVPAARAGHVPGADTSLAWPFSSELLRAHVLALLRRVTGQNRLRERYSDGVLTIDLRARRTVVNGKVHLLTGTEARLLGKLVRHAEELVSREDLLRATWGTADTEAAGRLHVYIHYLRHKVEPDPAHPVYILSRKGRGYVFEPRKEGFSKDSLTHCYS